MIPELTRLVRPVRPVRTTSPCENGQVLLVALIALVILTLATIFIFDLSSVIRLKMRSQTAVDAAALAAARWQTKSLNMIGEINLLKACTVLVDIGGGDSVAEIENASTLLSEMQARISFVGPLVGFAAAQQAAKNNGLYSSVIYDDVLQTHVELINSDEFDNPYSQADQEIPGREDVEGDGYRWRDAYVDMIEEIRNQGVAIATNTSFLNMPLLSGSAHDTILSALQDRSFYSNVNSRYWCGLVEELRLEEEISNVYEGKWWGEFDEPEPAFFIEESEYVPLDIVYSTGQRVYDNAYGTGALGAAMAERDDLTLLRQEYDDYDPNQDGDADGKIDPLPRITWAVYGGTWSSHAPGAEWLDGTFLESELRPEYNYGGAIVACHASSRPTTLTGFWGWEPGAEPSGSKSGVGEALNMDITDYDERMTQAESQFTEVMDDVKTSALAKPLGGFQIEGEVASNPPNSTRMILPFFTRSTIMPIAMDPRGIDPFLDWNWYIWVVKCLPELGRNSDLASFGAWLQAEYGSRYAYYYNALVRWNTPSFRQEGLDWLNIPVYGWVTNEEGDLVWSVVGINEDFCPSPSGPGGAPGPSPAH